MVVVSFVLLSLAEVLSYQNEGKARSETFCLSKDQKCYLSGFQIFVKKAHLGDLLESIFVSQDALESITGSEGSRV